MKTGFGGSCISGVLEPHAALTLVIAALAVGLGLGFRADLAAAMTSPISVVRIVLTVVLGLAATRLALLLARPEGSSTARLWPLAAVAVAVVVATTSLWMTCSDVLSTLHCSLWANWA